MLQHKHTTTAVRKIPAEYKCSAADLTENSLSLQPQTVMINEAGLLQLIATSETISDSTKKNITNWLQSIGFAKQIVFTSRKEIQFKDVLQSFLGAIDYDVMPQYIVGDYRVDFYVPKINLVIEYDENNHKYYNADGEQKREKQIRKNLYDHNKPFHIIRVSDKQSHSHNLGVIAQYLYSLSINKNLALPASEFEPKTAEIVVLTKPKNKLNATLERIERLLETSTEQCKKHQQTLEEVRQQAQQHQQTLQIVQQQHQTEAARAAIYRQRIIDRGNRIYGLIGTIKHLITEKTTKPSNQITKQTNEMFVLVKLYGSRGIPENTPEKYRYNWYMIRGQQRYIGDKLRELRRKFPNMQQPRRWAVNSAVEFANAVKEQLRLFNAYNPRRHNNNASYNIFNDDNGSAGTRPTAWMRGIVDNLRKNARTINGQRF